MKEKHPSVSAHKWIQFSIYASVILGKCGDEKCSHGGTSKKKPVFPKKKKDTMTILMNSVRGFCRRGPYLN